MIFLIRKREKILLKRILQARPIIASELKTLGNESLHLSTDIWTSRKGDGIIALRGQFIIEQENNFKVVAHTLGLKEFNDSHTSENIREEVTKILRLYDGALPKVQDELVRKRAHFKLKCKLDILLSYLTCELYRSDLL